MAVSFTESPTWVSKMKKRFAVMDIDKNGRVNGDDVSMFARKLAGYRKEGKEAEKRYFDTLWSVWSYGIQELAQGVNEDEFVQGMKEFVTRPDARECLSAYAAMVFELMDGDKNGNVSLEEFNQFHRAMNFNEDLIKHFFRSVDTNGDGVIQPSEVEESVVKFFLSA